MDAITTPINRPSDRTLIQSGPVSTERGPARRGLCSAHVAILKILAAQAVREHLISVELPTAAK